MSARSARSTTPTNTVMIAAIATTTSVWEIAFWRDGHTMCANSARTCLIYETSAFIDRNGLVNKKAPRALYPFRIVQAFEHVNPALEATESRRLWRPMRYKYFPPQARLVRSRFWIPWRHRPLRTARDMARQSYYSGATAGKAAC